MRLHDYFSTVKSYKLSYEEKNALYERILRQTQYQQPMFTRARFYIKVAGYMTFLGLLGLSIYVPFLGQHSDKGVQQANVVNAWFIAKVINVQGDYYIEANWQRIEWNNIKDGDFVVLNDWGELIIQVGEKVEGKISGPAKFVVNRSEKWYAITLKEWNYVELASKGDNATNPEITLISEPHNFTARTQAGKECHFVLTKENNKPLLVNKSDTDIQVVNEDTPEKTIFLAENKSVQVGTYIFASTATPTEVAQVLARATKTESTPTIDNDYDDSFFRGMLLASNRENSQQDSMRSVKAAPESAMMMSADAASVQSAPSYDPSEVRINLIPQFVWVDIKYVTYYFLNGQEHEYQISYENLLKRIYNLYDALQLSIPSDGILASQKDAYSLQKLRILAEHLQANLPEQVLDHQAKTLDTLVTLIQKLSAQQFGAYKWQNLSLEQMFSKIQ